MTRPHTSSKWPSIFGAAIGALTLIYFMVLVLLPSAYACEKAAPLSVVIALGMALSVAFIGGDATIRGTLKFPAIENHPLVVAATGGIAAFIFILLIASRLLACQISERPLEITRMWLLDEALTKADGQGIVLTDLKQRSTTEYRISAVENLTIAVLFTVRGYKAKHDLEIDLSGQFYIEADERELARGPLHLLTNVSDWRMRPSVESVGVSRVIKFLALSEADSPDTPIPYLVALNKFKKNEIQEGPLEIVVTIRDRTTGAIAKRSVPIQMAFM